MRRRYPLYVSALLICSGLAITGLALAITSNAANKDRVTVVFRYDDYSAKSPLWLERALFEEFAKRKMSLTVGVIPFVYSDGKNVPLDAQHISVLRKYVKSGVVEMALHGYAHKGVNRYEHNEFAGVSYAKQWDMICRGKAELTGLCGVVPTTFIPPWNSYDANTLRALNSLGFSTLSAAVGGTTDGLGSVGVLPYTSDLPHLTRSIKIARVLPGRNNVVVALFHQYDFNATGSDVVVSGNRLDRILDDVRSTNDVDVRTLGDVAGNTHQEFGSVRYSANSHLMNNPLMFRPMPARICPGGFGVYMTAAVAYCLFGSICLAAVMTGNGLRLAVYQCSRRNRRFTSWASGVVTALCVLLVMYGLRDGRLDITGYAIGLFAVGFAAGQVWHSQRIRLSASPDARPAGPSTQLHKSVDLEMPPFERECGHIECHGLARLGTRAVGSGTTPEEL